MAVHSSFDIFHFGYTPATAHQQYLQDSVGVLSGHEGPADTSSSAMEKSMAIAMSMIKARSISFRRTEQQAYRISEGAVPKHGGLGCHALVGMNHHDQRCRDCLEVNKARREVNKKAANKECTMQVTLHSLFLVTRREERV